jgi:hypothetical protein
MSFKTTFFSITAALSNGFRPFDDGTLELSGVFGGRRNSQAV